MGMPHFCAHSAVGRVDFRIAGPFAAELVPAFDGFLERRVVPADRVEAVQMNEHGFVVGRAGRSEDAHDGEFLLVLVRFGPAMDELKLRADVPAVGAGDLASQ